MSEAKYVTAFEYKGKILAVICLAEDDLGLRVEAAMHAGDEAQLKALVTGPCFDINAPTGEDLRA